MLPRLLPVRVVPIAGEALSSWFIRLARSHGEKVQSFGWRLVGRGHNLFLKDMDRGQMPRLIEALCKRTGFALSTLAKMTLSVYEGSVLASMPIKGPTRWMLPTLRPHATDEPCGLQFCASCLGADERPFFRSAWRLAFHVWCPVHRESMQERCGACGVPVQLHRLDVGKPTPVKLSAFLYCHACGADRRLTRGRLVETADERAFEFQSRLLAVIEDGCIEWNDQLVDSLAFFGGLAVLWTLLDDPGSSAKLWDHLQIARSQATSSLPRRDGGFERGSIPERQALLAVSGELLTEGSVGLTNAFRRCGYSSDDILRFARRERAAAPFWLWHAIRSTLDRSMYVPTDLEINSAIRHARSAAGGSHVTVAEVCRLLGMRTSHSARVAKAMRAMGILRAAPTRQRKTT